MIEEIIAFDKALVININQHQNEVLNFFMMAFTSKIFWVLTLLIVFVKIYTLLPAKHFYWIFLTTGLVFSTTDRVSVIFFKNVFLRLRPCHEIDVLSQINLIVPCGGQYSFISSHACNSMGFSLFLIMALHKKWQPITLLLLSFTFFTSISRLYLAKHYLTDIIAGWIVGAIIGYTWYLIYKKYFKKLINATF